MTNSLNTPFENWSSWGHFIIKKCFFNVGTELGALLIIINNHKFSGTPPTVNNEGTCFSRQIWNWSTTAYGCRNTIDHTYRCSSPIIWYLHNWTMLSNLSSKSSRYHSNKSQVNDLIHSTAWYRNQERINAFFFLRRDSNCGPTRPQASTLPPELHWLSLLQKSLAWSKKLFF
jgi:hypothetical protein